MAEKAPRRTRLRRSAMRVDKTEVATRVVEMLDKSDQAHGIDRQLRIQRFAKLHLFADTKDWPWEEASNVALPDMAEKSLAMQDGLVNSVMSTRPAVNAIATFEADEDKARIIDDLLDYQFFTEQDGEKIVAELAYEFVNEGNAVAFVPWVRESRDVVITTQYGPIPEAEDPQGYFLKILKELFPDIVAADMRTDNGWDWKVDKPEGGEPLSVAFYTTTDGKVEAVYKNEAVVYDGPRVLVKHYDEVYAPPRCDNLQPPSPSNPRGAAWVVLLDRPTIDEVARLQKSGEYDLLTKKDVEDLRVAAKAQGYDAKETATDDMIGVADGMSPEKDPAHSRVTRLMCFDTFDIDGDGIAEDVVWTVIKEGGPLLAKAKLLTDLFPFNPPRRPFAEASMMPLPGRRQGVSLPELTEGTHDAMKALLDQTIDAGTLMNTPWGTYRPQAGMNPEVIRMQPGELYPLNDPKKDMDFPKIGNPQSMAFGINLISMLQQMQDDVSLSDIQAGRIPKGASSALRTEGGMAAMVSKAEARPERILRRFFSMVARIYELMHLLNQSYLPENKQIRITGAQRADANPYLMIEDRVDVAGDFRFTFKANMYNTNRALLQENMQRILSFTANPLMIQLGITTPDKLYTTLARLVKSYGEDPQDHMNPPMGAQAGAMVTAEEALALLLSGTIPEGGPAEPDGWVGHLQGIMELQEDESFQMALDQADPAVVPLITEYVKSVHQKAQAQIQQMQMAQNAQLLQQTAEGKDRGGRPQEQPNQSPTTPQISGAGELIDERLPGAGGGANQ